MDIDVAFEDAMRIDTDSEASSLTHQIADQLYCQWLSLPDTNKLVKSLIDDAKAGTSFPNSSSSSSSALSPIAGSSSSASLFPAGSAPPLSPRSSAGSPRFAKFKNSPSSLGSPLKLVSEPRREDIPRVVSCFSIS